MNPKKGQAPIVIVGASLAGVHAAQTLRDEGYAGGLVLLSAEKVLPYDRPPLSKEVLRQPALPENLPLHDQAFYAAQRIDLRLGVAARAIDMANRQLTLADGSRLAWSQLLLTTGSRARQIEPFAHGAAHVHYLRELEDALRLRRELARLGNQGHMLVVGAGIIGMEVASVAAQLHLKVTVVEPGTRPLGRAAGPALAAFLTQAHTRRGVDIRCGVHIVAAHATPDGYDVVLSEGSRLHADLVVVGVGVVPNCEIAQAAGIDTTPQGIRVDGQGRTSVADVYAAGEVAFHFNARYGTWRREETWQHAIDHGRHVARSMLGASDAYAAPMSYWTDQYDYSVQVFGSPRGARDTVRGDPQSGSFIVFHSDERGVCGLTSVNMTRDLRKCKPLVLAHAAIPDEVIEDVTRDPGRHVLRETQPGA